MAFSPASLQPRYLSNVEAAEFLQLSPRTLNKLRVYGGGPQFHKFGRRVLYAFGDLQSWASARACESTSDPEYQKWKGAPPKAGR